MRQVKQTGLWLLAVLLLVISGVSGCNGGGLSVDYAPVTGCSSVDLDPADCRR